MNKIINNILARRSVRHFTDKKISKEDLEIIVSAGIHAPSGCNKQLWHFSVVQNKSAINKLAKAVATVLERGDDYNFYGPDAIILVSNEKDNPHGQADCACALENIFLASASLEIGSVWINQLKDICDNKLIRPILNELKIPENHVVWGVAALGYAEHPYNPSKRDTEGKIDFIL